jgi:hypothetical protein
MEITEDSAKGRQCDIALIAVPSRRNVGVTEQDREGDKHPRVFVVDRAEFFGGDEVFDLSDGLKKAA